MQFIETPLNGLYLIQLKILKDDRGFFSRIFCKEQFSTIGFGKEFVQFNHSFNTLKGTIRGMHYQKPPFAETKLIRCIQGAVYDVAVDLREGSPTFLQHFGMELSEENMVIAFIPEGFAHGFQTLENNTALMYHHTAFYTPEADDGLCYNDPALKIAWKLPAVNVSEKDKNYNQVDKNFKGITI